ncbi:Sec-independent protein translocase protein TatB [Thioclava sp. GXIMD4216]|uniref:Sec-independent protein translocase protein TatB n=1 Tax=Thioclava sp. GXIMD4216 TaxID=3131929 RepID=UPI0030CD9B3E
MFDIGWSELLVIGVVALIVVGPKDLPVMFRTLGRLTGKAKAMAREFSRAMEDAADQAGLAETSKELKGLTSKKALGLDALERATEKFEKWQPGLPKAATSPQAAEQATAPVAEPDPNLAAQIDPSELADEPEIAPPSHPAEVPATDAPVAAQDRGAERKETP